MGTKTVLSKNSDNEHLTLTPTVASSQSARTISRSQSAGSFSQSPSAKNRGGGSAAYVHLPANQFPQPGVYTETKLTGDPVIVAEWGIKKFVWWNEFARGLPDPYKKLLQILRIVEDKYSMEIEGFYAHRHDLDPSRRCDVDCMYLPIIRCGKYHPYYSVKHKRRASNRTLERLEFLEKECRKRRVKFDYLICVELTLPKQISEMWSSVKTQRCVRRAARDFLRDLYAELFPKHHSQFGCPSNHHFWASKTPLDPHRHIHLTVPNVCYNSKTDMFHRINPSIDHEIIKECWKRALKRNGLWVDVPDHLKPDCYIQYIKFSDRNKVMHRLTYCCRKPTEDMCRYLTETDLENFDGNFALFLLNYTPRVVNLGFMTDLKRFGYSRKPNAVKCPICGGNMHIERDNFGRVVLYDRPPPGVPFLRRTRKGIWRPVQPGLSFVEK